MKTRTTKHRKGAARVRPGGTPRLSGQDHERMVTMLAYLEPEQKEMLDRLSTITRVPRTAYLREAVNDLLKKYKPTINLSK